MTVLTGLHHVGRCRQSRYSVSSSKEEGIPEFCLVMAILLFCRTITKCSFQPDVATGIFILRGILLFLFAWKYTRFLKVTVSY